MQIARRGLLLGWVGMGLCGGEGAQAQEGVRNASQPIQLYGRTYRCNVALIDLKAGKVVPRLLTAMNGLGRTEPFEEMIRRSKAVAAINGSFFAAYNPTDDKAPDMLLIRNGQVVFRSDIGSVIGFLPGNTPLMDRVQVSLRGTVTPPRGKSQEWYAYWVNRTPQNGDSITIFTPAYGARTRVTDGVSVVVNRGIVTRIEQATTTIPPLGYVIHFRGSLTHQALKFAVGATVEYRAEFRGGKDPDRWREVVEAVGAGPRLVTDGQVTYNPEAEDFQDPKILTNYGLRSAIGINGPGELLLVTVGGVTVRQMADVMRALGCNQAMNLDGGASSGLYVNGKMLTRPGRALSNALVFVRS